MKLALFGISDLKIGKHNLKDPRLDQADKLVPADKKVNAQVDLIGEKDLLEADAILTSSEMKADLILKDLEFVETRLGREPAPAERAALEKIKGVLENEKFLFNAGLTAEDLQAVAAHSFYTSKPITVATADDLKSPDALLLRAFAEAGYISFLTAGGKENRAWPIRKGTTALEAAGSIHTDMQKGFIRAEIIGFADFIEAGGETQAKRAGKQRLETKQYVMQDYDLTNFRFNK
jgi:ribosome-binding ATPase YchF (GTP1/OBG family)